MKILVLLISLLLVGCGTTKPAPQIIYQTVEVEVPVYRPPKFKVPSKPPFPTEALNWSHIDDHEVIGKAYVKTIHILSTHVEQLRNLLEGIKKGEYQN